MNTKMQHIFEPSSAVRQALRAGSPVVALESAVITHGLKRPLNLQLARDMEQEVRQAGAIPATVGVIDGEVRIGLTPAELERLASDPEPMKIGPRDFAAAFVEGACGGTTVAGTMHAAHHAGIRVFATGGIGGVHREARFDVSPDLQTLAITPMIVVCAGAKAVLDLPATLEYLETMAVPVVLFGTDEFPAFYSRKSGLESGIRLDTPAEVVELARAHWELGLRSAVLVAQPPPNEADIPPEEINPLIAQASHEAQEKGIHGQALTPFLLERLSALSGGRSVRTNLALLLNNARLAAEIARQMALQARQRQV